MFVFGSNLLTSTKSFLAASGMMMLIAVNGASVFAQSSPAFNCNKARTSNEITICRNSELGRLDRQVTRAYGNLKSRVNRSARVVIIADQRAWLTTRQNCRSDVSCTRRLYIDRLSYLNRELAPYNNGAPAPGQPPAFNPTPAQPPVYNPPQVQPPAFNPAPTQPPAFNPTPTQPPAFNPTPTQPPTFNPAPTNAPSPNTPPSQNHYFPNGTYKIHILSNSEKLNLNQTGDRVLKTGPARGGQITQHFNVTQTGTANGFVIQSNKGIRLHAFGKGDQLVSTRYQPFNEYTRFKLIPANDGCYFITTIADNKYWIWNPNTYKIQSSYSPTGEESMFCFTAVKTKNPQPPRPNYQPPQPPAYQPPPIPTPTPQPPRPTYQPAPPQGNSPPPFSNTPDRSSHFKQPVSGKSLGGIVREGPGINYRRLRSFRNGRNVRILANSGVRMNGFDWFQISLGNNRTAYQWGGIMCSNRFLLKGIYRVCSTQRPRTFAPPRIQRAPIPRFNPPRPPIPRGPAPRRQLSDEERNQSICGPGFTFVGNNKRYRGIVDRQGCVHTFQIKKKKVKRRCGRSFTYVGFNSGYRANRNGCYRTSLMRRSQQTGNPVLCAPGFAHLGKKGKCKNIKKWNAKQRRKSWPKCKKDFHFVQGKGCTHQSKLGE